MKRRVLILEDDESLGPQLVRHLEGAGFEATLVADGRLLDARELAGVDLVVLDLMLPSLHGFDILKDLRAFSGVPVLVLSARNETSAKVRGLRLGADDYMTKPFWPEEFVERVQARLRRPVLQRTPVLEVGALSVDREARLVTVGGVEVGLTRVEFDLLALLAQRAGAAVTRRVLADTVLDPDKDGDERTLDVHVSRLRKKLGTSVSLETVWGIGYRLNSPRDP